jgi:hypothetical protein
VTVVPGVSSLLTPLSLTFGGVLICSAHSPIDERFQLQQFQELLTTWIHLTNPARGTAIQEPIYLNRHFSHLPQSRRPRWEGFIYDKDPDRPGFSPPPGPYFDPENHIFAESIPSLAALWLGNPALRQNTSPVHGYMFDVTDPRGRFRELRAEGNELLASVELKSALPAFCTLRAASYEGEEISLMCPVKDSSVEFTLPGPVRGFDIWLVLGSGEILDHYEESPRYAAWGVEHSLFSRPLSTDPITTALVETVAEGEHDTVEFKSYINLVKKDGKARELLETACAFSNSSGGSILFGVSDYGDLKGIETDLRKSYGERCSADTECLRTSYVADIRRLLAEGLSPLFPVEAKWHEFAGVLVLQIAIPESSSPSFLNDNGESFRRVGATNRRIRPDEWAQRADSNIT